MAADTLVSPVQLTRDEMEQRRLEAVELLKTGVNQSEVARRLGVTRTSAMRWARRLRAGQSMQKSLGTGRPSLVTSGDLYGLYRGRPDGEWTGKAFAAAIEDVFHVTYDSDHAGKLLKRCRG